MAQKKLQRFKDFSQFTNTLEYPQNMAGNWHIKFNNVNPIVLELACGRGEYTVSMAAMEPNKNYIGVDVKGNRMYLGAKNAIENNLDNVLFLRTQIDHIHTCFATDEVDEIWITFPDPQLRVAKAKKRLTHPNFLLKYASFLKPEGIIHLKTDSPRLYWFTMQVIQKMGFELLEASENIKVTHLSNPLLQIKTHYEQLNISGSGVVFYIQFKIHKNIAEAKLKEIMEEIATLELEQLQYEKN